MPWLQVIFNTTREQQALLEAALLETGAASITYEDAADQPILEPALHETPLWNELVLTAMYSADTDMPSTLQSISEQLSNPMPPHKIDILEDKDWVKEWMQHYQPIQLNEKLWICPSWLEAPDKAATTIMLDPGLAFGTGSHPTTALCLKQLSQLDVTGKTVIDYGCGSGILAIAALLMGATTAIGIDIDPQAITASRNNARLNGIDDNRLQLFLSADEPSTDANIPADIVLANILAGPLVELAPKLEKLSKTKGHMILSGVLSSQQDAIINAYPQTQFGVLVTDSEWLCLSGVLTSI